MCVNTFEMKGLCRENLKENSAQGCNGFNGACSKLADLSFDKLDSTLAHENFVLDRYHFNVWPLRLLGADVFSEDRNGIWLLPANGLSYLGCHSTGNRKSVWDRCRAEQPQSCASGMGLCGFFFDVILATAAHHYAGHGIVGFSLYGIFFVLASRILLRFR